MHTNIERNTYSHTDFVVFEMNRYPNKKTKKKLNNINTEANKHTYIIIQIKKKQKQILSPGKTNIEKYRY